MVSAVAPQIPLLFCFSSGVSVFPLGSGTRHGPMLQCLQQLPTIPIGQGFIVSTLSKAVLTPSLAAFLIILIVALSMLLVSASAIFLFPSIL
jgi:hypothetical protein